MFEDKMGFNQHLMSDDPDLRQGVLNWLERVQGFYGEVGVDVEIIRGQLLLTSQTVDYIYSEFTPLTIKFIPGSRPLLEKIVSDTIDENMGERDKALAIMRWCRDNLDPYGTRVIYGGSEEELIKSGTAFCNEIARVYAVLCQIGGLPTRIMCAHISGHMMNEVYIEQKWWWIDPMQGMYNFLDDGAPASTWDLINDPSIFEKQDKNVWEDCRPTGVTNMEEFKEFDKAFRQAKATGCYFYEKEAIAIGNYFVWDFGKYTFPWVREAADPVRLEKAHFAEFRMRKRLGWPDFYFDFHLFEGTLKTK